MKFLYITSGGNIMKKVATITCVAAIAGLIMSVISISGAYAAEKKGKPQTLCPVEGGAIDKKIYVDYKGHRIYFCCAGCPEEFNKDPEKYMKKIRESGVTLEKTPQAARKKGKTDERAHPHAD